MFECVTRSYFSTERENPEKWCFDREIRWLSRFKDCDHDDRSIHFIAYLLLYYYSLLLSYYYYNSLACDILEPTATGIYQWRVMLLKHSFLSFGAKLSRLKTERGACDLQQLLSKRTILKVRAKFLDTRLFLKCIASISCCEIFFLIIIILYT